VDVVVSVDETEHPPVKGVVVKVGRRRVFVPSDQLQRFGPEEVRLSSARLDLVEIQKREGEILLAEDVLDHQLVDVNGARVVRAADLYLLPTEGRVRLVGVDAGFGRLLGRVGPRQLLIGRRPSRIIDWAAIHWLEEHPQPVQLRGAARALRSLPPAELADLVEELGRSERQRLLAGLEPATAADVLEEMEPDAVEAVLREASPEQAAQLLSAMAPDEAVDALRDLPRAKREELVRVLPASKADLLVGLLAFPESAAGGLMTPQLVVASPDDRIADVVAQLRGAPDGGEVDAVAVVDAARSLLDDVPLLRLLLADSTATVAEVIADDPPVTVEPDTLLPDLVESFVASRRSSILVVDAELRPLGRILADDVIDALVQHMARPEFLRRWPRA
jgi:CBS domain-containing protein